MIKEKNAEEKLMGVHNLKLSWRHKSGKLAGMKNSKILDGFFFAITFDFIRSLWFFQRGLVFNSKPLFA
jgi:hypothetical protein